MAFIWKRFTTRRQYLRVSRARARTCEMLVGRRGWDAPGELITPREKFLGACRGQRRIPRRRTLARRRFHNFSTELLIGFLFLSLTSVLALSLSPFIRSTRPAIVRSLPLDDRLPYFEFITSLNCDFSVLRFFC